METINRVFFQGVGITILLSSIVACGGGGDSSGSTNSNGKDNLSIPLPTNYSNPNIYPVSSTVSFKNHSTGDVFKLSDTSAWRITGTSNSSNSTRTVTSNVTISLSSVTTPDPVYGTRSGYYLVGSGITPAFFVEPILITPELNATAAFKNHYTGDVFKLSDGSVWQITGASNSSNSTGTITSNVTIYTSTDNTPNPVYGNRSGHYLIGDSINPAFFIKKILLQPSIMGTVSFKNHSTGDVFKLSDGSVWQITGTSNSSNSTGTITSRVIIYFSTPDVPDPKSDGVRSDYYLIGEGINPAFFIKPI